MEARASEENFGESRGISETFGLPDLLDGLGHRFVGRNKREPRVRRAAALPEFAPRVMKLHHRWLQVLRKFRRNKSLRLTSTAEELQRFASERKEMILRALGEGRRVAEVLTELEEAFKCEGINP